MGPLTACLIAGVASSSVAASDGPWGDRFGLRLELEPILLDYELPGHPNTVGASGAGMIFKPQLLWGYGVVGIEAGVLLRFPFALDFTEEFGAAPLLAVVIQPFGDSVLMRVGSLDIHHGFHPGILDELRYGYSRPYQKTYNQSLVPEARREFANDPFLPVEYGAQLIADVDGLHAEVYLDWQLLETIEHREKFAFGILGEYNHPWFDLGFQYRLLHYGGQNYTQKDPIRAAGLDNKRQPTSLAVFGRVRPIRLDAIRLELLAAFLHGRMIQTPGGSEETHYGVEPGLDLYLFEMIRLGYRAWLPEDNRAGYVSEDSDPVYSQGRSHRFTIAAEMQYGIVGVGGKLDLVLPDGSASVQTLTVLAVNLLWEPLFWSRDGGSDETSASAGVVMRSEGFAQSVMP